MAGPMAGEYYPGGTNHGTTPYGLWHRSLDDKFLARQCPRNSRPQRPKNLGRGQFRQGIDQTRVLLRRWHIPYPANVTGQGGCRQTIEKFLIRRDHSPVELNCQRQIQTIINGPLGAMSNFIG
jgi:hypothetical protein